MNNHGEVTGAGQSQTMAQLSSKIHDCRPGAALKALGNRKSALMLLCCPSLVLERKWQLLLSKRIWKSMAQHACDKCVGSSKVNVNDKCLRSGFWLIGVGVKCTTPWVSSRHWIRTVPVTTVRFHRFKKVEHRDGVIPQDRPGAG